MSRKSNLSRLNGILWILVGFFFIADAFLLVGKNLREDTKAGRVSVQIMSELEEKADFPEVLPQPEEQNEQNKQNEISRLENKYKDVEYVVFPDIEMPIVEVNGFEYIGKLDLPTLNLTLPVQSDWDNRKLQNSPCRYAGSVYQNNMVLSAHNYSSHFGKLDSMQPGDAAIFYDNNGNIFEFCLTEIEMLNGTDIEKMIDAQNWDLTLFTCTVGGLNRITARFRLVNSTPADKSILG